MENAHEILETLNSLSADWSGQFDIAPDVDLSFRLDESGKVIFHGKETCLVSEVDPSSVFYGVEYFGFRTKAGIEHRICFDWPFEGPIRTSHMCSTPL